MDSRLRELANKRGWSLNQAANYLLHKGAGLADETPTTGVGDRLDAFIGCWSEAEAEDLDRRVADACEQVEEDLWK
ncbi:MAG: hypothetical protein KDM81_16445 [Verrucomicrobiae bacterium]|nr:hypothetical protein [Verrucomicrobiae bacterium]